MGADSSKCANKETLAEKRYKIERPRKKHGANGSAGKCTGSSQASKCPLLAESPSDSQNTERSLQSSVEPPSRKGSADPSSELTTSRETPEPDQEPKAACKHFLTRRERVLLEHSWRKTKKTGADHVGAKIFFMVLTAQPDIKAIFGLEKIPTGRLKYDPRFRQHALVYTKTLDYVIRNLDYPGKIEIYFESLGKRHVAMQGRGFNPTYWETFAECMTQAAVEWEANRQRPTLGAWRNLVSCIISFMRRGFDEEIGKKRGFSYGSSRPRRTVGSYVH